MNQGVGAPAGFLADTLLTMTRRPCRKAIASVMVSPLVDRSDRAENIAGSGGGHRQGR